MADPAMSTLAMTQGLGLFFTIMPRFSDVRETAPDGSFAKTVRHAELAATAGTIGVGLLLSALSGDSMPLKIAIVVAFGFALMYEVALRSEVT